jgi:Tfp pilus assembly protein PilX
VSAVGGRASPAGGQRGAATLVIVMMMFLIMALLAAYANRSLLFEQRMANSYYRAGLSQDVAEAAIEWSVAMLNGGATDQQCLPVEEDGLRFADRYLRITAEDRGIKQNAGVAQGGIVADCSRTATGWTCRCPNLGTRVAPAATTDTVLMPSFGIGIRPMPDRAGTVRIDAYGCTNSVVDSCRNAAVNSRDYQGLSRQQALLALVAAVRSPPAAPLVVVGNLSSTGTGLGLHNTDARTAGLLYTVGGTASGLVDSRLESVPGTLPSLAQIQEDKTLRPPGAVPADIFRMFLGATAARYQKHPSLRAVRCNGACETALLDAYRAGGRILWVDGALAIGSNVSLGSADDPVVVVATGNVALTGPFRLTGLLAAGDDLEWTNTSGLASLVNGAVLVQGDMRTSGAMDIAYDPRVIDQLRNRVGSYVRVPGGWMDIQ